MVGRAGAASFVIETLRLKGLFGVVLGGSGTSFQVHKRFMCTSNGAVLIRGVAW